MSQERAIALPAPQLRMFLTDFSAGLSPQRIGEKETLMVMVNLTSANFVAQVLWPHKNTQGIIEGLTQIAKDAERMDSGVVLSPNGELPDIGDLAEKARARERRLRGDKS